MCAQLGLPSPYVLPDRDMRVIGEAGVAFELSRPPSQLAFGPALVEPRPLARTAARPCSARRVAHHLAQASFNTANADPLKRATIRDLFAAICQSTGVPLLQPILPSDSAVAEWEATRARW